MSANSVVLQYTESDRITVLKEYGRNPETVRHDIVNVKEWMAKQAHLPEIPGDNFIERFLLLNKFRIETVKKKLDMYYTARTLVPELYDKVPSDPDMQRIMDVIYYIPLPKLTRDLYRITVTKLRDTNPDSFDAALYCAHTLNIADIRLREDYTLSEVQIFDLTGVTVSHLLKFHPGLIRRCALVLQKVFSSRVTAIHFINAPSATEYLLQSLKMAIKPKVLDRVYIHKDAESLRKHVSVEILPKEFGGAGKSLNELSDDWRQKLLECDELFQHLRGLSVNEELRDEALPADDFFGAEGNFRKLELD